MKYTVTIRASENTVAISHIARLIASVLAPRSAAGAASAQFPSAEPRAEHSTTRSPVEVTT